MTYIHINMEFDGVICHIIQVTIDNRTDEDICNEIERKISVYIKKRLIKIQEKNLRVLLQKHNNIDKNVIQQHIEQTARPYLKEISHNILTRKINSLRTNVLNNLKNFIDLGKINGYGGIINFGTFHVTGCLSISSKMNLFLIKICQSSIDKLLIPPVINKEKRKSI